MFIRLSLILIAVLMGSEAYAQSVRAIYFYPNDQPAPNQQKFDTVGRIAHETQIYYRQQMAENGFGEKTFNLEDEGDGITIYIVRGSHNTEHYSDDGWEAIADEITDVKSDINLVVFQGVAQITDDAVGIMQRSCSGHACTVSHFTHDAIVAAESETIVSDAAHELGHAFGLQHNLDSHAVMYGEAVDVSLDAQRLHVDELRWLDKHKYFNDNVSPNTPPIITKMYDTQWVEKGGFENVMLSIDIEGEHALHQVQISRVTDGVVIGSDAIMGLSDNACFYFRTYMLKSDAYLLQVIDKRGNMRYVESISIQVPAVENTQPILGVKPGAVHSKMIVGWAALKH